MELTEAFLERIEHLQPVLKALVIATPELAIEDARRVDRRSPGDDDLPLRGMPIMIKDNIDLAGYATSAGSLCFKGNIASRDAEVVRRLRDAGAIVLGKANLHEFAFGVTSNSPYGTCRNPWDPERIPGGSSGGSGVAVAADLCVAALGTDTGGSIRLPAAFNGVVGLRPSIGAVSTRGTFPVAHSFDTVGPMARSVADVATVFEAIAGYDAIDPWSRKGPVSLGAGRGELDRIRIGVPRAYFFEELDGGVEARIEDSLRALRDLRFTVREIRLDGAREAYECYGRLVATEALAVHWKRFVDEGAPMGADIRTRLEVGTRVSGRECAAMRFHLAAWRRAVERVLSDDVDVIATPVATSPPPYISAAEEPQATALLTRMTRPWSLAQMPSMSLPCGFTSEELPVGVQLTAPAWREGLLVSVAGAYQRVTEWHRKRPRSAFAG